MKKFFYSMLSLTLMSGFVSAYAQDTPSAVLAIYSVQLHGAHCENIIHKQMPAVKGVLKVKADAGSQTVKVTFSKQQTNTKALKAGFKKIGYEARLLDSLVMQNPQP